MPTHSPQSPTGDSESQISNLRSRISGPHSAFIGLVLLAFAALSTGLMGDYCYDDIPTIRDNKFIERWGAMRALATRDFGPVFGEMSYRPVAPLTYFLDAIGAGKEPLFSRFFNLTLHIAVGLSLFGLWRTVFGREDLAFLAAALFLVHPIVTETVNCSGFREDLLAMLFMVWAIRALAAGIVNGSFAWIALAAVLWFLALLSKEPAAMALLLAPILLWRSREHRGRDDRGREIRKALAARSRPTRTKWVLAVSLFGAVLVLYGALYLLLSPHNPPAEWPGGRGRFLGFLNFCRSLLLYLGLWAFPVGLSIKHAFVASTSFGDARLWAGLGVLVALAVLSARLYVRENPAAGTGGLWVCISLVPLFQIVPTPQLVAERYLYMPHAGMALLIAALVLGCVPKVRSINGSQHPNAESAENAETRGDENSTGPLDRTKHAVSGLLPSQEASLRSSASSALRSSFSFALLPRLVIAIVLVVACATLTFRRNRDWIDDTTLNIRAYELWDNADGRAALGALYMARGEPKRALGFLREALAMDPNLSPAHRALGILLLQEGRRAEGRIHLEKAFELDPADPLNRAAVERLRAEDPRAENHP